MISYDRRFGNRRNGQSLIELLVAISIGAILIVAAVSVIVPALLINRQVTPTQTGASLGAELLNNVRAWSEGDWHRALALATGTANTYYVNAGLSPYTTSPGIESIVSNPVSSGLVGWWKLDEGTGTVVNDSSGNNATGSWSGSGTKWITGIVGAGAATFVTSTSDVVNIGHRNQLDAGLGSLTAMAWFRTTATGTYDESILDYKTISSNAAGYDLEVRDFGLEFRIANGATQLGLTNGGTYNDGSWHQAVGVIDRGLGKLLLYVDGTLVNTTAFTTSWDLTTAGGQAFTLGGYNGTTPNLTGSLDDVRVYNRALSAAEINQIYTLTATTNSLGLVGWWKFDEGTGTIANDASGNGYNGSWGGTAAGTSGYYSPGKTGGWAGTFNGSTNSVNAGNGASLNTATAVTVGAWVNFSGLDYVGNTGKFLTIASKGYPDTASGTPSSGWLFSYDNRSNKSSFAYICFGNANGGFAGGGNNLSNNYVFSNNTWYYIAFTVDASHQARLYINGAQLGATVTLTNLVLSNTIDNLKVGNGVIGPFSGLIDDVRVYNRALSAAEINQIYSATSANYTRYFYLSDVYRTAGMIVTSGGTYDPSTKLVTVIYQLPSGATSSFAEYLTRHGQVIYDQTDWSGGGGANGPATTTNNQFATSSGVSFTTTTGSVYVSIPGY